MKYRYPFNFAVAVVCAAFISALIFFTFYRRKDHRPGDKPFLFFLISSLLISICHFFFNVFRVQDVGNYDLVVLFYTLETCLIPVSFFFLTMYVTYSEDMFPKRKHIPLFISGVLAAATLGLCIYNHFSDVFSSINPRTYALKIENLYTIFLIYPFLALTYSVFGIFLSKDKRLRERIYLSLAYIFLALMLILDIIIEDTSLYFVGISIFHMALFFFDFSRRGQLIAMQQKELSESQITLMISQIQPHFIYNCLSSISELIKIDPKKAQEAINDFSLYLRGNFTHLRHTKVIPFNSELEHVKNYLKLEKMRFDDRLNIEYDIQVTNFFVPALSLQPIVENAVKHGVCKKIEGGTVKICTTENDKDFIIKVIDDGVGFDMKNPKQNDERIHVGLTNVTDRLKDMMKGRLEVTSAPGEGATVVIYIPKDYKPPMEEK